jgi:hypothetical protein
MPADVKSIEAIADWKVALVNYRELGIESVGALQLEVQKAYTYLEETAAHFKRLRRVTEEDLVQAKAELSRRQLPDFSGKLPDTTLQKKAVHRCKMQLEYCDEQIDKCHHWRTKLPRMVSEEYEGPARRFVNFLDGELSRAISGLEKQVTALDDYASLASALPQALPQPPSPEGN